MDISFFFFSSRRRHTRFKCDWSSDVCSSDLRPEARTVFVVGYGSGVTARVLADVPGMQRVRVVEIEPAVLEMERFFLHVNDTALARRNVSVTADSARSA